MTKEWECKDCRVSKPLSLSYFYAQKRTETGFMIRCKECSYNRKKRYIGSLDGRLRTLLGGSRTSARQRNYEWDLKIEDLYELYHNQSGKCALTGDTLTLEVQTRRKEESSSTISIDRIDNEIGYIKSNIQFVTLQSNICKNSFTTSQLIEFCKKVVNHYDV